MEVVSSAKTPKINPWRKRSSHALDSCVPRCRTHMHSQTCVPKQMPKVGDFRHGIQPGKISRSFSHNEIVAFFFLSRSWIGQQIEYAYPCSVSDIQDGSAGRVRASLSSETLTTIIDPEPVAYVLLKREKSNTPCRGMKRGKKREGERNRWCSVSLIPEADIPRQGLNCFSLQEYLRGI